MRARRQGVDGSAAAQTSLTREGQVVDVPLIATIAKTLTGSVIGRVYNADGTPGANALVEVGGSTVTAGEDGTFGIDNLPLGRFVVRVRSQVSPDTGVTVGEIRFDGDTVGVTVALKGLSEITGTGAQRQRLRRVRREAGTDRRALGPDGPCVQFALPDGTFRFVGVCQQLHNRRDWRGDGRARRRRRPVDRWPGEERRRPARAVRPASGRVLLPGVAPPRTSSPSWCSDRATCSRRAGRTALTFSAATLGAHIARAAGSDRGRHHLPQRVLITGPTTLADAVLDTAPPTVASVTPAPSAAGVHAPRRCASFLGGHRPGQRRRATSRSADGTHDRRDAADRQRRHHGHVHAARTAPGRDPVHAAGQRRRRPGEGSSGGLCDLIHHSGHHAAAHPSIDPPSASGVAIAPPIRIFTPSRSTRRSSAVRPLPCQALRARSTDASTICSGTPSSRSRRIGRSPTAHRSSRAARPRPTWRGTSSRRRLHTHSRRRTTRRRRWLHCWHRRR